MSTALDPNEAKMFADFTDQEIVQREKLHEMQQIRLDFALNHHVNTRGEAMDFDHYPHIRFLYNCMASSIALMGSVQSMKSEWSIIDHFSAAYSGLSVFFVLPKFEMRTTYVQNRIDRCCQTVDRYKKIIGEGFFSSVAIKNFGKGVIKYVGSNVLSDFKEFPADMIVVEEVDQCAAENLDFALDRMRASKYQFTRYLGNPTIKNTGIHMYFMRGTQREWTVPCLDCGKFFELDWFTVVAEEVVDKNGNIVSYKLRDTKWEVGCRRDIKCVCPECGGELERASERGRWIAKNPGALMESLHISMMCSMLNSISGMWERFLRGLNDPGLLKQFFNSDLGLPYNAAGNKVTETVLDRCIEEGSNFVIHPDCAHVPGDRSDGPCSMGIDVGARLDIKISELTPRGRRTVYVGKIRTHSHFELHELIERYNVEKAVIDSGPESMLSQDFQDEAECDVWLCRYGGEGRDRRKTYNVHERVINVDRTEALDRSYAALRMKRVVLPENYAVMLDGEFVAEMCMPVRQIVEDTKGNSKFEWTKGTDHQRHSDTYDLLAADLMRDTVIDEIVVG